MSQTKRYLQGYADGKGPLSDTAEKSIDWSSQDEEYTRGFYDGRAVFERHRPREIFVELFPIEGGTDMVDFLAAIADRGFDVNKCRIVSREYEEGGETLWGYRLETSGEVDQRLWNEEHEEKIKQKRAKRKEQEERAEYERLKAKYGPRQRSPSKGPPPTKGFPS